MAKATNQRARELSGLTIYQDPKRGTIFYDIFTRKGYILTTSDVKKYTIYSSMLPICVILAVGAMSLFSLRLSDAAIIFAITYLIVMIAFRFSFFYKLPVAENWKPFKRDSIIVSMAKNYSSSRLTTLLILLVLLTILMPMYTKTINADQLNTYASYVSSVITGIFSIITLIAIIQKKRNNY